MKFTKSVDGKRRTTVMVEFRVGHADLLTAACSMAAHNELQDFLESYGPDVDGEKQTIKPKVRLSRLSIIAHLKEQFGLGRDSYSIGRDFESDCDSIAWILNNKAGKQDREWTREDVCSDVEVTARKQLRRLYPELTKADEAKG